MSKINELYKNQKSKGFVNHLIKSYLPPGKVNKVWNFEKNQSHTCNVCGQKLVSIEEIMKAVRENEDEIMSGFMKNIQNDLKGIPRKIEDNPYIKVIGKDKLQGFTGEKTDTTLCMNCIHELLEMVQNGFLLNDINIVYQVKQTQRDYIFNSFTESKDISVEEKKKVTEIKKRVDKKRVATFGDLEVLQQLKKKMESGK
jgi:hypothetical protein